MPKPHVVVFSTLYPGPRRPLAGVFIQERMRRLAERLPLSVVSPQPWFPLQGVIRKFRPGYRPVEPATELRAGLEIRRPRFLAAPGTLRGLDGHAMALAVLPTLRRLRRAGRLDVLDAHFGYPEGLAAVWLGRRLGVPVTITLRGTEVRYARIPGYRERLARALQDATRLITVSESLRREAIDIGADPAKICVISNGVDTRQFAPLDRAACRARLGISERAKVLISVGGLVERKGFHRVIEVLPRLRQRIPGMVYLIIGAAGPEGDWTERLQRQIRDLRLGDCVRLLGAVEPDRLAEALSASDVFVLATRNEGWANVFLEAMACGLPVVTTEVGGNSEVVCDPTLGATVPFGDSDALLKALASAIVREWDRKAIREYAVANSWPTRIDILEREFLSLAGRYASMLNRGVGSSAAA